MPYSRILEATGGLDVTPHSSGGHKLGEGGFGEVFYCRLMIGGQEKEAAVKVFRKMVHVCVCHMDATLCVGVCVPCMDATLCVCVG